MKEKVVLITGCSSGIGKAFTEEFLKKGFKVIATARKPEKISTLPAGTIVKKLDVTNKEDMEELFEFLRKEEIVPDILINNAGYGLMGPAIELPREAIERQFETNVFGALAIISKIAPLMIRKGKGLIVNISSISGIMPTPFASAYCASKAALTAFSDSLRMELKPFGIKVVTVQPGAITSKFGDNAEKELQNILRPDSVYSAFKDAIIERAKASQEKSTPAEKFVKQVVKKLLRENPPPVIRAGKLSKLVPFLKKYLPEKILDSILMAKFGGSVKIN